MEKWKQPGGADPRCPTRSGISSYRAIIVGIFMVAIPVAGLIGSPVSGAILYATALRPLIK